MMNREQILATDTVRTEAVAVPEWGGTFHVRGMSVVEMARFHRAMDAEDAAAQSPARVGVRLLIACVCDDQGRPVFRPEDAEALERQGGALIDRLCVVANRVNGIGPEAREAAEKK
jgi:hypothetical protein